MKTHSKLSNALLLLGSITLVSGVLGSAAHAVPVNGAIGFGSGNTTLTQSGGTSTITFNSPLPVEVRTGDYSTIPHGTLATFAPISWTGSGASAVLTSNNNPEWTINLGGTTFQLSLLSLTTATMDATLGLVNLQGTGVATITGAFNRDPTFASFFIQQSAGRLEAIHVSCSTCGPVPRVPEGGSAILLLAGAVVGLEVLRRRLRALSSRPASG